MKPNYKKDLVDLTKTVTIFIAKLDLVMVEKSTFERGKHIAQLSNYLDMANDAAMHFGLGYSFKKITSIKKRLTDL